MIRYDKMQERPSVQIEIQGRRVECLLDTGARINVINEDIFNLLNGLELRESKETLRCANNSRLEIFRKNNDIRTNWRCEGNGGIHCC